MKITWIGHSCFKVETKCGSIVFDPYQDGSVPGYADVRENADMVVCSHEHGDHSGRECVRAAGGGKTGDLKLTQIDTWHDDTKGSQRGANKITIIDDGEGRLAHFGDLGCDLTEQEAAKLTGLDAVLIPVGGYYTIDGVMAAQIVKKIKPRMIVPMHYSNEEKSLGYPVITSEKVFLHALEDTGISVKYETGCTTDTNETGVVVLSAQNG